MMLLLYGEDEIKKQVAVKKWCSVLLSGLSGSGHHRCVTLLYVIPMWIFDCVLSGKSESEFTGLKNLLNFENSENSDIDNQSIRTITKIILN